MEYICEVCKKAAEVFCSCDTSHQYCYRDFLNVHQKTKGEHNGIDIVTRIEEINQNFIATIKNLEKVKKEIISRSNEMIQIIQIITKSKLSSIEKYIDCCAGALKKRKLDTEKIYKDYQNIETREFNLETFQQITIKNFSIFKYYSEIIDFKLQKELILTKLKSLRFSKNVEEIKKQLQTNFSLFLEGHVSSVKSVAVTSDNKYIISASYDKTIRI